MSPIASKARFDESRWPVVVVTMPVEPLEGAAFTKYLADAQRYYTRGQHFGFVFDIRNAPLMSASQRRMIADEIDRAAREFPTIRAVQGVVIASAMQRGIVKAINWLARQPAPTEVFATVEEAVAWVQKELRAAPAGKKLAG
jgi:hypothetical protein